MKRHFIFIFLLFGSMTLLAQNPDKCGVNDILTDERLAFENSFQEKKANSLMPASVVLTLPVVIHVVYHTTAENIPDAQLLAQMDTVARDFRRLNADTVNTPVDFQPVAADSEIEFCLASRDPDGQATNGITRTYTDSLTFVAGPGSGDHMKSSATGGKNPWDATKYLNIWVVNLTNASAYAGNPMGHGSPSDGIVAGYNILDGRHLLSHEIGHYLNLIHIYGNEIPGCQPSDGGDQVSDTPDQAESVHGCPAFPQTDSCTTTAPGIMFMNFMDQTDSYCQNLFTQGQVTRMRDAITGPRSSLLASNGCVPAVTSAGDLRKVNRIEVFPNPTKGKCSMFNAQFSISNVEVYNILGETVLYQLPKYPNYLNYPSDSYPNTIDLSNQPSGIYFIKIRTQDEILTKKIVKE